MIQFLKKYSSLIFGLVLLALIINKVLQEQENFLLLRSITWPFIVGLALVNLPYFFFLGMGQNEAIKPQGVHLKFKEWYGLCTLTTFLNLFLPAKGGIVIRALYLKSKYALEYKDFSLSSLYHLMIGTIMWAAFGFLTYTFLPPKYDRNILTILLIYLAGFIGSVSFLAFPRFFFSILERKFAFALDFKKSWERLHTRKLFFKIATCFFFIFFFDIFRMKLSLGSVGIHLSYPQLAMSSIALLSILSVPLIPGNLGLREAAFAFIYGLWGVDIDKAILASLIDRAIYSGVMATIGIPYYFYFSKIIASRNKLNSLVSDKSPC